MISLQLPQNQSYLEPGLMYLTDEGMWIKYDDNGEEELLCDNDGYICDTWEDRTNGFIAEVFYSMKKMEN